MFPDSATAAGLSLGRTNIEYMAHFSLGCCYKDEVMKTLFSRKAVCPKFVSCFDESLNEVKTKKQIEMHIISFDENTKQITKSHIRTEFNGHRDAEIVVKAFKSAHGKLDYVHSLAQISMDGPNINWKIVEILRYRREEDTSSLMLLELESCELHGHVLHGAYQTAQSKAD